MNLADFMAPIGEGGRVGEAWLTLTCFGFGLALLVGLLLIAISVLVPKGGRLPWSLVTVLSGAVLFGLAWEILNGL